MSRCEIVTGDGGQDLATAVTGVLDSIATEASADFSERVSNGCRVAVSIVADLNSDLLAGRAPSSNALRDGVQFDDQLQQGFRGSDICAGTGPVLDHVTVDNRMGQFSWTGAEVCGTATASISQAQIDLLNELLSGTDLLQQLKQRGAVTVDAEDRVTDIKWRALDEACTSSMRQPEYAPVGEELDPSYSVSRQPGLQAKGAWVYLCGGTYPGGTSARSSIEPWDWPKSNPGSVALEQRSRCHLIAKDLGGTGDDVANLVSCFQKANNEPYMKKIEQVIRRLSKDQDIFYLVKPQYTGVNGSLKGIRIVAIGNKGVNLDICVKNLATGGFAFHRAC
jgi:hypothetical protein